MYVQHSPCAAYGRWQCMFSTYRVLHMDAGNVCSALTVFCVWTLAMYVQHLPCAAYGCWQCARLFDTWYDSWYDMMRVLLATKLRGHDTRPDLHHFLSIIPFLPNTTNLAKSLARNTRPSKLVWTGVQTCFHVTKHKVVL